MREKEKTREKKREKERKDGQCQLLSICIQFAKRKTMYIGRNNQNLKKLPKPLLDHYPYKSS